MSQRGKGTPIRPGPLPPPPIGDRKSYNAKGPTPSQMDRLIAKNNISNRRCKYYSFKEKLYC